MAAKKKTGRPRLEFDLRQVEQLAAIMCTDEEIAGVLGCHVDTITERKKEAAFSGALEKGRAAGKSSLRRLQWKAANGGNPTMLIWLGKQWLGQADKTSHEVSGPDGGPIQTEDVSAKARDQILEALEKRRDEHASPTGPTGKTPR